MVDLASIPFFKSFGLSPCIKHQHVVPEPEGVGPTSPKTYGLFHLNASIADRFHRSFHLCDLFWAVDRGPRNTTILSKFNASLEYRNIAAPESLRSLRFKPPLCVSRPS